MGCLHSTELSQTQHPVSNVLGDLKHNIQSQTYWVISNTTSSLKCTGWSQTQQPVSNI